MGLDLKILFCPLNYLSIIELYHGFFVVVVLANLHILFFKNNLFILIGG